MQDRGDAVPTRQCRVLCSVTSTETSELGPWRRITKGRLSWPRGDVSRKTESGKNEGSRAWGCLHRLSLTVRQGLTALEADLEPEGAVERARVLQHSHIQHRHLGHHLARGPQLQGSLLRCPAEAMATGAEIGEAASWS